MQLKSTFFFSTIFTILSVIGVYVILNKTKISVAYVDINLLVEGYTRTGIERAAFEKKAGRLKANQDSLIRNWQDELKQYEKERSTMSQRELALKQELLSNKQQQINQYQQVIEQQIQAENQKTNQLILQDINNYITKFGKQNPHHIILGALGNGNIMYAKEQIDLTQQILDGLNNQYHPVNNPINPPKE